MSPWDCASSRGSSTSPLLSLQPPSPKASPVSATLVVVPMSLLTQWRNEVQARTSMSVHVHYGSNRDSSPSSFARFDVVITTYGVLSAEFHARDNDKGGGGSGSLFSTAW